MPIFTPANLANWTGGHWTSLPDVLLHNFAQDSRKLEPGQVFVALKTAQRDGHDYVAAAFAAGASAAIVNAPIAEQKCPQLVVANPLRAFQVIAREHRRLFRGPVIGVTGSCGKTSTKNLLARMLGAASSVLATEGNLNNHIGVPLTLTRLEPGVHDRAVIEAGISGPGEMGLLAELIEPEYGLVTLVAPAHTAELGGIDGVAREKAVLLHHIRPSGLGVFPAQCWSFAAFQDLPQTSIVVAPEGEATSAPHVIRYLANSNRSGTELMLGRREFQLPRVSRGMAQNAALAIVLASELGITDDILKRALLDWQPAKWRGELRQEGGQLLYLDFYNANPASMSDALENFYAIAPPDQPRLLVLGCMEELGPDSARYHRELGRNLVVRSEDRVFLIGSDAESIRAGLQESASGGANGAVEITSTLAPVAAHLRTFHGAVFMKGSRRYELERALENRENAAIRNSTSEYSQPAHA